MAKLHSQLTGNDLHAPKGFEVETGDVKLVLSQSTSILSSSVSIVPTNSGLDLGSAENPWGDIYVSNNSIRFVDTSTNSVTQQISATSTGIDFGSAAITASAVVNTSGESIVPSGTVSGSAQVIELLPAGTVSSSAQLSSDFLDELGDSVITSSAQVIYNDISNNPFTNNNGVLSASLSIIPSSADLDLGSAAKPFRDVYVSSGSLYINGQQVLSTTGAELRVTTDVGESIKLLETGNDTITFETSDGNTILTSTGTGIVEVDAPMQIAPGKKISSSDGNAIQFGNTIGITGSVELTGNVDGVDIAGFKSSFDTLEGKTIVSSSDQVDVTSTTNYSSVVQTTGNQSIGGVKTFTGNNIFNGEQTFNDIAVNGTASFAVIQQVTGSAKIIGDAFIVLNNNTPSERYAGISVYDSGSAGVSASFQFDGQSNDWFYEYSDDGGATNEYGITIFGPEYNTKGSPTYLTSGSIPKADGGHHLYDSNISDDDTLITLGIDTVITGGLDVQNTIEGNIVSASTFSGDGSGLTNVEGITLHEITVEDRGSGNKFIIDNQYAPQLSVIPGKTYKFDQSDSTNTNHPLAFRLPDNTSYTDGVTTVGTPGTAGAYTELTVGYNTSGSLKYYCTVHGNSMGNLLQVTDNFDAVITGSFSGSFAIDNDTDNRVITAKGDGGFNAESGLTYDGSTLSVTGAISSTGDITGNTSDDRLKDRVDEVDDALEKVDDLTAFYYRYNELANSFGLHDDNQRVGLSAQELQEVLPEVVAPAPFDIDENGESKSGENYLTVRYERVVPLLVAAIKELKEEIETLKK